MDYYCRCYMYVHMYILGKIWQLQVELRATQEKVEELQQQNTTCILHSGMNLWNLCTMNIAMSSEFTDEAAVIVQGKNLQNAALSTQASAKIPNTLTVPKVLQYCI